MDRVVHKLAVALEISPDDAQALIDAGLRLPRDVREAKVADLRKVLGRSKADKVREKLKG